MAYESDNDAELARIHFGCERSVRPQKVCYYTRRAVEIGDEALMRSQLEKIVERVRNGDEEMIAEAKALSIWIVDNTQYTILRKSTWRQIDKLTDSLNRAKPVTHRSTGMNLKNAAALVRNDITTITVRHDNGKHYTYKCLRTLAESLTPEESLVNVYNARGYTLGTVVYVDSEPEISPDADFEYRWAFQRVRTETAKRLEAEDEAVARKLEKRKARAYRDQILSQLGVTADEIPALLSSVDSQDLD